MRSRKNFVNLLARALFIVWSVLLAIIFAIIVERLYSYAEYIALKEAITSTNKDIAYRSWVASHGGVYVPIDKRTPPSPYLTNIKNRDFNAIDTNFTLMNPAYTLSQMMGEYSKLYGVKTKITSKHTLNPKNSADSWETLALNQIDKTRKDYSELSEIDGEEYLRLMTPLVTEKSCLKCHAIQGYKLGDVRGGVSVSVKMAPLYKDALHNALVTGGLLFIIWFVGALGIHFFTKKIHKYIDEKEQLYEEYIYGLVSVVEKRDTYTAGHSTRVADYAELIAREMGYSERKCHILHRAGMLHDIGKVAIPDSVFLKPTKLNAREYKLIQEHVAISYDMLKNISIFDEIKEIVRDHHEHFDGSGYPRGLKGDDTPMLAQILSLADSFDAMTTDRIYKGRKSVKEALLELEIFSGKQFNPKVVQSALIALKNVSIEHVRHQNPESLLEQERFSYFYKDALTDVFNESYLRSDIPNLIHSNYITWISLKNFHMYNNEQGWNAGDKLLKELADALSRHSKESIRVYRFYGDNFLVLLDSLDKVTDLEKRVNNMLQKYSLDYRLKRAVLVDMNVQELESLEDVLKQLF